MAERNARFSADDISHRPGIIGDESIEVTDEEEMVRIVMEGNPKLTENQAREQIGLPAKP